MKATQGFYLGLILMALLASCSDDVNGNQADSGDTSVDPAGSTDSDNINGNPTDTASDGGNSNPGDDDSEYTVRFPGTGTSGSGEALEPGIPPETADECNANTAGAAIPEVVDQEVICFYGADKPDVPAAAIEQVVEVVEDREWVHLRLTLDPAFVDNSYGENSIGWEDTKKQTHTFKDLVGSDHAEMLLYDANGTLALHFKVDYISEDTQSPSGYSTLGVTGGEGKVLVGDAADVIGVATSLNRNLNGCGLNYVVDSPASNAAYVAPVGAENWDFRVVYEIWVDIAAFGDAGFGKAVIEQVHASPAKQKENTILVVPDECPTCDPTLEECDPWRDDDTDVVDTDVIDTSETDTDNRDTSVTDTEQEGDTNVTVE